MRALAGVLSTLFLAPCAAVTRLAGESSQQAMSAASPFVAPSFCHGLDCPAFEAVSSASSYEVRRYAPSVWVATVVTGASYDKAVNTGFMRLFSYIGGANEDATKIEMTTPVLVDVVPGPGPTCGTNFTVAFFAGAEGVAVPAPTSPDLFVRHTPERTVYVASYGGWASESTVLAKASELSSALAADGRDFQDGVVLTASYDSPFRLLGRHNEVWLIAK